MCSHSMGAFFSACALPCMRVDMCVRGRVCQGGCVVNASVNPCLSSYAALRRATANAVDGFSQQPTLPGTTPTSTRVGNTWLDDGTPVFVPPRVLWYPNQVPWVEDCSDVAQLAVRA